MDFIFLDLEHLPTDYEHSKVSNEPVQLEFISIRQENAVQAVRNILPYLQDEALVFTWSEIANNLRVMLWNCVRCTEYPCRFTLSEIARMLLVSRWTLQRRVLKFGLAYLSRCNEISDEQQNEKIGRFMQEHECFVDSSMISGYLRSEGLRVQQDRIRKCLSRIDP